MAEAKAKKKTTTKKDDAVVTERKAKKDVIGEHSAHQKDTGSVPVQVGILTERITHLTGHLKDHPKDDDGRKGLMYTVAKRRKLLKYLKDKSKTGYESLIKKLGLRH